MPEGVRYTSDAVVLRIASPVTMRRMLTLATEVDLAREYYGLHTVDLHVHSLGGELQALEYFLARLACWRADPRFILKTLAVGEVASAAAVLVSMGSVGQRRALATARLLYHTARVIVGRAIWTREDLRTQTALLAEADERLSERLAAHVFDGKRTAGSGLPVALAGPFGGGEAVVHSAVELASIYAETQARSAWMSPEEALRLHLIDAIEDGGSRG